MNILIGNIVISVIIFFITKFFINKRTEVLLYFITFVLLLSPSTIMLGFSNNSALNIHFSYFITLFLIPSIFISNSKIFGSKLVLKFYIQKIGKPLLGLIFLKLSLSIYRFIYYDLNPFTDFLNSSKEFLFLSILTYFYVSIFVRMDKLSIIKFIKSILLIFTLIVALMGILVLFDVYPFNLIQKEFFEFKSLTSNGTEIIMTESILRDKRSYSLFTSANQFGAYASLAIAIASILFKRKMINIVFFLAIFISCLLIVFSSQSRTGFFFFVIFFILTLSNTLNFRTLLIYAILIFCSLFFYDLLPDRLTDSFNSKSFNSNLEDQRMSHWFSFFNYSTLSFDFIFNGFYNSYFLEKKELYFESGLLNTISKHGLISFFIFYFLLFKTIILTKTKSLKNNVFLTLKEISFWVILILLCGELFQGWILTLRYETITSIFISLALIVQIKDVKFLNPTEKQI